MRQFTREEAAVILQSGKCLNWSDEQILMLQLYQRRFCVPFKRFNRASIAVLEASVYHAGMTKEKIRALYEKRFRRPTDADIDELLHGRKIGKRKINMGELV